jgi:RsiW-degrading membrane proteinase PrsW (M82 family)
LILYTTLACCAIGAALLIYRHDLYEREPVALLILAVAAGAGAMWLAGGIEGWTLNVFGIFNAYAIAAVAAVEEESLKLLVIVALMFFARREFNDPMDGIIYGSMAGLGMAVEESVFYLQDLPAGEYVLPPAELVRLLGHLVMGGISGFALGAAVFRKDYWLFKSAACFSAAVALHFGWDWIALSSSPALASVEAVAGSALMFGGLLLYGSLTAAASRHSHAMFSPLTPSQLWGWPFTRRG